MTATETRSAIDIYRLCLAQAHDFLEAAEKLSITEKYPHIVYHLGLLAMEEIGKGSMVFSNSVANADNSWVEKRLESHTRKLQWALWTPMGRIDPKNFEAAGVMAKNAHELRLSSLYVDPNSDFTDLPPKEIVSAERAASLLKLARSRLKLEEAREAPDETPDELLIWFLDTMASDGTAKKYLLSEMSIDKHNELGDDARAWVAWARDEIEKAERKGAEILQEELAREAAHDSTHKPRWRAKTTIYTPSHAIRAKILSFWNEKLGKVAELVWTGKKDSFDLRITLHDNTSIKALHDKASNLAKLFVACLNLGSIGYFWFQRPGYEQRLFKLIEDFEHPDMLVGFDRPKSFWGDGRAVALTETNVTRALECFLAFAPMKWDVVMPIFQPYLDGLALLAKSDEFFSFDEMARESFRTSLGGALHLFAGWDGSEEKLASIFHDAFSPFLPEQKHREEMFSVLVRREGDPEIETWERLRATKHSVDLYLMYIARQKYLELIKNKK